MKMGTAYDGYPIEALELIMEEHVGRGKEISARFFKLECNDMGKSELEKSIRRYKRGGKDPGTSFFTNAIIGKRKKKSFFEKLVIAGEFGVDLILVDADELSWMEAEDAIFYDFRGEYIMALEKLAKEYNRNKLPTDKSWEKTIYSKTKVFKAIYNNLAVLGRYDKEDEISGNLEMISNFIEGSFDLNKLDPMKGFDKGKMHGIRASIKRTFYKRSLTKKISDNMETYIFGIANSSFQDNTAIPEYLLTEKKK